MKYLTGSVDETLDAMVDDVIVGPVTHRLLQTNVTRTKSGELKPYGPPKEFYPIRMAKQSHGDFSIGAAKMRSKLAGKSWRGYAIGPD
jgi:hypothetical protein